MAGRKARAKVKDGKPDDVAAHLRMIASLLGLLATKDMGEGDKIVTLNAVGFGNQEIARLLSKDANTVKATLSQRRQRKTKKRK